jgi:hypothetical protein
MTLDTLRTITLQRLDDPTSGAGGYYGGPLVTAGLNWAQRLFQLLTLCLEKSDTLTLSSATTWYHVRTSISDWLLPLRAEWSNAKVRPARLSELDALDTAWQGSTGTPERYAMLGEDLLAVYKQATGSLTLTYAYSPATLVLAADTPEIPVEYHSLLPHAAILYCRLIEGGQELAKVEGGLREFLAGANKMAQYVRARSRDKGYDTPPPELDRFDLSRLLPPVKSPQTPAWLLQRAAATTKETVTA